MSAVAHWVAILAGLWLIGLGVFMAVAPRRSLAALAAMGGTKTIHFGEMGLRALVGLAFILSSPDTRSPAFMTMVGAFLTGSALVLASLPRRWHSTYSRWWAARISPLAVRLVAPFSIVGGGVLIWILT